MLTRLRSFSCAGIAAGALLLLAPTVSAQDPEVEELRKRVEKLEEEQAGGGDSGRIEELENENEELRQRQDVLEQEIERFELRQVIPQVGEVDNTRGLGPAGAKIYGVEQGLSIGEVASRSPRSPSPCWRESWPRWSPVTSTSRSSSAPRPRPRRCRRSRAASAGIRKP